MLAATEQFDCVTVDAKPTGAKLDIPERGVHIFCDCVNLQVGQELPQDDGSYFLSVCKGLVELVRMHFAPKVIPRNGILWKSYLPFTNASEMLKASLQYGGTFQVELAKAVGMLPEHKNVDFFLSSGSKDLHVVLQPVTFDRLKLEKRNVDPRATREQKSRIDRYNKFVESVGEPLSNALVLDVDLMENDPPKESTLAKHFEELKQKNEQVRKLFETR